MLRIARVRFPAAVFAGSILLLPSANATAITVPDPCTAAPAVTCTGPDDVNTSALDPFGAQFIAQASFLDPATAASGFTGVAGWSFTYAANPIPAGDLNVLTYTAWAVNNTPPLDPDGGAPNPRATGVDGGGANFILRYTPRPNSTDPPTIDFLQLLRISANGGPNSYSVDSASDAVPLYIQSGGYGNALERWMYDIPWSCEDAPPGAVRFNCIHNDANDERTLSESDTFQTMLAVDGGIHNGVHSIVIYGGITWGYDYTNFDVVPEPSLRFLTGAFLLALAGLGGRRRFS